MAQSIPTEIRERVRYWWLFLLTGLVLIGVGLWILRSPAEAYISLSMVFAACILFTGILETSFAAAARNSLSGWGWTLASGILDIAIGIYLLAYPLITMQVLPFVLGFWLLFRGAAACGFALDLRSYHVANWGLLLVIGILIVLFGFMVLAVPAFGVLNIIFWTSLSFIAAGVFRVILAFRLKKLSNRA